MRKEFVLFMWATALIFAVQVKTGSAQTFCNPLNLFSHMEPDQSGRKELDDPSVVLYQDNYFLFASNAGGYWNSADLISWKFIKPSRLPLKSTAPAAFVVGDWLYFASSMTDTIFRTNDPLNGKWEAYTTSELLSLISDFTVFVDKDSRVYCYYGCTNNNGVMARELDAANKFKPLGVPMVCRLKNPLQAKRSKSAEADKISIRGSWLNQYKGKYYYQCAEQNSESGSISDVVFVSEKPFGPFVYAANNPFSYRPDGFVNGAGNGSTFSDKFGNWWHVAVLRSSENNQSNSQIGLFPSGFDKDGILFTKTDFGDYPIKMPGLKYTDTEQLNLGWSLLSFQKKAESSTGSAATSVSAAFDENVGTFWTAHTGKKGEWLSVDLGSVCTINAIQVNFPDQTIKGAKRQKLVPNKYIIEFSNDKRTWNKLIDKTANTEEIRHQYEELKVPVQAQYLKITNHQVPEGNFAVSEFRVFGTGTDKKPKKVASFRGIRDYKNPEITKLFWEKQENVTGYNIRYGAESDKLYHSYQVFKNGPLKVRCPDKNKTYWFQIDAFNENGVTPGKAQQSY